MKPHSVAGQYRAIAACILLGAIIGLLILVGSIGAKTEAARLSRSGFTTQDRTPISLKKFPETHSGPHAIPRVDGAINPAGIPEEDAELSLLRTARPKAGNLALKAARAYLRKKLSIVDDGNNTESNRVLIDSLISIVKDYDTRLTETQKAFVQEKLPRNAAAFFAYRKQLLTDFRKAIVTQIGSDGETRMQAALDDIKRNTRIF